MELSCANLCTHVANVVCKVLIMPAANIRKVFLVRDKDSGGLNMKGRALS